MALVACILWLAGFEVLPWTHVALHDHIGPHHHDAGGSIVLDQPAVDQHHDDDDRDIDVDEQIADVAHDDDDVDTEVDEHGVPVRAAYAHAHRPPDAGALIRLAHGLTHGQHSLAHHDLAVYAPAPPLTHPMPIDRRPISIVAITTVDPVSLRVPRAAARDPPFDSSV